MNSNSKVGGTPHALGALSNGSKSLLGSWTTWIIHIYTFPIPSLCGQDAEAWSPCESRTIVMALLALWLSHQNLISPSQYPSHAKLDGMVRFKNTETEPGRRHSAGALGPGSGLKCLVAEFILVVFCLYFLLGLGQASSTKSWGKLTKRNWSLPLKGWPKRARRRMVLFLCLTLSSHIAISLFVFWNLSEVDYLQEILKQGLLNKHPKMGIGFTTPVQNFLDYIIHHEVRRANAEENTNLSSWVWSCCCQTSPQRDGQTLSLYA